MLALEDTLDDEDQLKDLALSVARNNPYWAETLRDAMARNESEM
jgi:hypothetical protein